MEEKGNRKISKKETKCSMWKNENEKNMQSNKKNERMENRKQ